MAPIEAYDPWVTGGLLYFAVVWFRLSAILDNPVSLAESFNLILVYPIRSIIQSINERFLDIEEFFIFVLAPCGAVLWAIAAVITNSLNLFPNAPSEEAAVLYTMAIPFAILGDFLIAIPIEVAVVIASIAFLDIVVGSDRYGTS